MASRQQGGVRPGAVPVGRVGGPYDADDIDPDATSAGDTVDFGSVRVPVPPRGTVSAEPTANGRLQAVHVAMPEGRLSISALAAPKSSTLWPELVKEIDASLRDGGARVRSYTGDWGRELHARTDGSTSVFVGADGPRWMVYGVATGPTRSAVALDAELRRMMRGTVVVRGRSPYPVRTVLPLVVPDHLKGDGPSSPPPEHDTVVRDRAAPAVPALVAPALVAPALVAPAPVAPAPVPPDPISSALTVPIPVMPDPVVRKVEHRPSTGIDPWDHASRGTWQPGAVPDDEDQHDPDWPPLWADLVRHLAGRPEPAGPGGGEASTEPLPVVPPEPPAGRASGGRRRAAEPVEPGGRRRAPEPVTQLHPARRPAADPAEIRPGRRRAPEATEVQPQAVSGRRRKPDPDDGVARSGRRRAPEPLGARSRRLRADSIIEPAIDPPTEPMAVPVVGPIIQARVRDHGGPSGRHLAEGPGTARPYPAGPVGEEAAGRHADPGRRGRHRE